MPVEGEEMWPVSEKPRPQAPAYATIPDSMPGRPKNNDRRREESEKPKPSKKMTKHGTVIICSMCGTAGHNKTGCKQNPYRGKKKKTTKKRDTAKVSFIFSMHFSGFK